MAGVVAGLNSAPITRLKRTKELLSAKTVSLKANLDATLDSTKNFANYKEMLKTINPPCVPFFGKSLSSFVPASSRRSYLSFSPLLLSGSDSYLK